MAKGTIKRLIGDKGYGFIQTVEGKEVFFHRNDSQGLEFSSLKEGQEVEYETSTGRNGRPQAIKVKPTVASWNFRQSSPTPSAADGHRARP